MISFACSIQRHGGLTGARNVVQHGPLSAVREKHSGEKHSVEVDVLGVSYSIRGQERMAYYLYP